MPDLKSIIELKFNRKDFEEIYFKNGQGNIFWGQNVKGHFTILLVFAFSLICAIIYSILTNHLWGLPIFLFFIFLLSVLRYERLLSPILKWRKQVNECLNRLSKFKTHRIILTTDAISIVEDNEETITKWTAFTKAQINDDFISLISTDTFLFPKKSMTESDYKYLTNFISDKLKNGL